jgi:hypothetical protein
VRAAYRVHHLVEALDEPTEAEVDDEDVGSRRLVREQNVLGLEVTVHDPSQM